MGNLLNLAVYNPAILDDDDFLAAFVARQDVLDKILRRLQQIGAEGQAEHRLIVGQRGMGKTSLLRRIAIAVERDANLSATLLPLTFREEQYNVHNLHLFWCNCLDALGDYLERHQQLELMRELDSDIASIARAKPKGVDDQPAYEHFMRWMQRLQRRALLLLDNMDFIFDALDDNQSWALRRQLQEAGGVVVIGAATRFLESADQPNAPFYEFFRVDLLACLQHEEMLNCLRELAQRRGVGGEKVLRLLAADPARIRTLRDLSGGNPRTVVLLYLVLETDADGDVMSDLERLLDQVSPLYKGRIEDLAPQSRVIFDAIALHWDPITASEIATASGIAATSVSAQLDRLLNLGLLEKCALSRSSSTGYQLGERFFNIWYLMRHAPRRVRGRLRWLVEFLRGFYAPHERSELAKNLLERHGGDGKSVGQFALALRETLEDGSLRHALGHHATRLLEDAAAQTRTELAKIVDLSDLHGPTHTMTELRDQVLNCQRDWYGIDPKEFWDWLGGNFISTCAEKQSFVEQLSQLSESQLREIMSISRKEKLYWVGSFGGDEATIDMLRQACREGILADPYAFDWDHAAAAAEYLHCPELLPAALALSLLSTAIREQPLLDIKNVSRLLNERSQPTRYWASCWLGLGYLLQDQLNRFAEAEQAYRQAIALDDKHAYPWNSLGNLLQDHLNRPAEAEQAYRQAIALDDKFAHPWYNLGNLLKDHLNRFVEAEQAYRQAIALDNKSAYPWNGLGNLLQYQLNRYAEAEQAYRQAIALDNKLATPWNGLGNLLQYQLNRYAEAEQAYRQAIALDDKFAYPWNGLGNLLQCHLNRYMEAEQAYCQAIALDDKDAYPWNGLGNLLKDHLNRHAEAEQAYRQAIALDDKEAYPWNGLGNLLQNHLNRYAEAEQAYRQAIALDNKFAYPWNGLGNLLQDHLNQPAEAEQAYRQALQRDPNFFMPIANLTYLLYPQADRIAEAEKYYEQAFTQLPQHASHLLQAFRELAQDNFGAASAALRLALDTDHAELLTDHLDDLLRNLRLAASKGYGDKLLAFLDETGLTGRYWPLRAAFDAYLHGAERLRDVNPEVRGAAQRLYDWLASQQKQSVVTTKPKSSQRRKSYK